MRSFSALSEMQQEARPHFPARQNRRKGRRLPKESGVTLLMVAVGMFSLLAMLVLSLDVINLYVSSDEAQKTADAAALAGAEALANSGTTSAPLVIPWNSICNTRNGDADLRVQAVAAQNTVAGSAPTTVTDFCDTPTGVNENPQIHVSVTRTGLPTFFAKMWSSGTHSVSATATAEAYNPSYDAASLPPSNRAAIAVHGVKPWLVSNCCDSTGGPFFDTSNYAIANPVNFVGQALTLTLIQWDTPATTLPPPSSANFYALDGPAPLSCPANSAVSCSQIGTGTPGLNYHDNIACEGSFIVRNGDVAGPGQTLYVDTRSLGNLKVRTTDGTTCLIHADTTAPGVGQDSFTVSLPTVITGGYNNPNTSLQGVSGLHRSDSVIAVPVFKCPSVGTCDGSAQLQIVGLLQLAIQYVDASGPSVAIHAVVLNAAGLDPNSPLPAVTGAGTSPVPVRLINPAQP